MEPLRDRSGERVIFTLIDRTPSGFNGAAA